MKGPVAGAVVGAVAVGLVAAALAYALPVYAGLPSLYYEPERWRWTVGARPGPSAMGYYGQIAWGLFAGAIAGGATWLASAVAPVRRLIVENEGLLTAWALTALLLVGAWATWSNWP